MLYNYTVTLQSKQQHKPRRFKTTAHDIGEVINRFRKTIIGQHYTIKSIMRSPK